jgi:hypothetical protein
MQPVAPESTSAVPQDVIGSAYISDKIGDRKNDLMNRYLDSNDVGIFRIQPQHDQRPTASPGSRAVGVIFDERIFIDQVTNDARNRRLAESCQVRQFGTRNLVIVQGSFEEHQID